MKHVKVNWFVIVALATIKFILPFLLQSHVYELHRDEYLYYEQGQHIALGYLENPPLLSWLGTISSWAGGSAFSDKILAMLIWSFDRCHYLPDHG
jgi:4-amino-4-deoxy-L-arabinose transferase-like glycosyltransferase